MGKLGAALLVFLAVFAASFAARTRGLVGSRGSDSVAAAWSATDADRNMWLGLQTSYAKIDEAVAPIVTNARTRAEVVRFVAARMKALEKTQDEFLEAVRVGHVPPGTPLLYDGVSWIETR